MILIGCNGGQGAAVTKVRRELQWWGLRDEDMWWLGTPRKYMHWQCLGLKMPHSRHLGLERSDMTWVPYLEQGKHVHSLQFLSLDSGTLRIQGSPGAKILGLCSFNRAHLVAFHLFFPFRRHPSWFQDICNGRVGPAVTGDFVSFSCVAVILSLQDPERLCHCCGTLQQSFSHTPVGKQVCAHWTISVRRTGTLLSWEDILLFCPARHRFCFA